MQRLETKTLTSLFFLLAVAVMPAFQPPPASIRATARQDPANELSVIKHAPTDTTATLLRGGPGVFGSPRAGGKKHAGLDIVANLSNPDKTTYLVRAVSAGVVAYARVNGAEKKGYGYTVIIDHQNGYYTLYAHLTIDASRNVTKLGQQVTAGQTIGFLADLSDEYKRSSGNVWADDVLPDEKIQLHFELFKAPAGRSSTTSIDIIKSGATIENTTVRLKDFNYRSR